MGLKALIFDVDGTLAETETLHLKAMNVALAAAGLPFRWHATLYRDLLKIPGGRNRLRRFLGQHLPGRDAYAIEVLSSTIHTKKDKAYRAFLASGELGLRPGVGRLIREARRSSLRLAIATATSRSNLEALLQNTCGPGAVAWFEVICTAEEAPRRKPAPDVYVEALRRLDLSPEDCLAIEDSEAGVQAAGTVGLPVVVTENIFTRNDCFDGAVAVVSDLGEPGQPFRQIRAPISGGDHVDVAQLRDWHKLALKKTPVRLLRHAAVG
ncbi:MAG: HAD-IA family hydrolase [Methyloligellaceae bacterium]